MAKKVAPQLFRKCEQCFSCHFKADEEADPEDDERVIILCSLESEDNTKELEDEGDTCPSYQAGSDEERAMTVEDAEKIIEENKDMKEPEYEEVERMYVFRGDSLVEILKPSTGQKIMRLLPSFVEYYNAEVAGQKSAIQKEIDRLQGQNQKLLEAMRNKIMEAGEAGEKVSEDDIKLIIDPDTDLTDEEQELDAEMAITDDEDFEGEDEDLDEEEEDEEFDDEDFDVDEEEDDGD